MATARERGTRTGGGASQTRVPANNRGARTRDARFRPVALAKVTSKGQITIPKNIRNTLQLREGDTLEFLESRGAVRIRRVFDPAALDKWIGHATWLQGIDVDDLVTDMRGE